MNKSRLNAKTAANDMAWWLNSIPQLQAARANDAAGLSSAEAISRLTEFGPNLIRDRQQQSLLLQFLSCFKN